MELMALLIVSVELIMKFRWVGVKIFIHHPRSMVKVSLVYRHFLHQINNGTIVGTYSSNHDCRIHRCSRPAKLTFQGYTSSPTYISTG